MSDTRSLLPRGESEDKLVASGSPVRPNHLYAQHDPQHREAAEDEGKHHVRRFALEARATSAAASAAVGTVYFVARQPFVTEDSRHHQEGCDPDRREDCVQPQARFGHGSD